MSRYKVQLRVLCAIAALSLILCVGAPAAALGTGNSASAGPCEVSVAEVLIDDKYDTYVYYPGANSYPLGRNAPYPGIVLVHGFALFGLNKGTEQLTEMARHMASWGYVVGLPVVPDTAQGRIAGIQAVLSYFERETTRSGGYLQGKVDTTRYGLAGHSAGGGAVFGATAHDHRIKAVVGLDPVCRGSPMFTRPMMWDAEAEGNLVTVPALILGGDAHTCNGEGEFNDLLPLLGATHRVTFHIVGANHCDFLRPNHILCNVLCGGETNKERTDLIIKYMLAWFNYYLYRDADQYAHVYGAGAAEDVQAGRVTRQVVSAPRSVATRSRSGAVQVYWEHYDQPVIAGYNVYRRLPGQAYPQTPLATLGNVDNYVDATAAPGVLYYYTVCSRDADGNLHQRSADVNGIALNPGTEHIVYLPIIVRH